jgi:hypothetical protein
MNHVCRFEGRQFYFPVVFADHHTSELDGTRASCTMESEIGLDPTTCGTHSMRRTKPTLIYRRTKNLRAMQRLLGHSKLESTVRDLGVDVDDALEIAEQTEI